ncbi:MAG: hypothetical protein IPG96_13200 [Proteobacteria bacterium]|nr:hypothetical protein [Pseudomonadota bacterium]
MAKKQTRRSISVRGTTYDALRAYCDKKGVSMSEVIEERVAALLSLAGPPATREARPAPAPAPVAPSATPRPRVEAPPRASKPVGRSGRQLSVDQLHEAARRFTF